MRLLRLWEQSLWSRRELTGRVSGGVVGVEVEVEVGALGETLRTTGGDVELRDRTSTTVDGTTIVSVAEDMIATESVIVTEAAIVVVVVIVTVIVIGSVPRGSPHRRKCLH